MSTDLLKIENILLELEVEKKENVINVLAGQLEKEGIITNFEGFLNDIYAREKMDNTAVGFGVAIPHGKSEWITEARLGFAKLKKEMDWGDEDEYVRFVFLIAVPEKEAGKHIEVLAGLSQKILDENFREKLEKAKTKEEVCDLVNG